MPEPVTLVVGGLALYAFLKGRGATVPLADLTAQERDAVLAQSPSGALATQTPITILPSGALQTSGSTIAAEDGIPLGESMHAGSALDTAELTVPADLVAALDADTALRFRQYAALNPADFEAFLDRYADRVVLRNDLFIEMLTAGPPEQGFEASPGMLIGMGTAAYKVVQGLNGVAAGKSFDIFGISASAAGAIPGVNQDFVSSLQGMAMGYRAITSLNQVMSIASTNGVNVLNFSGMVAAGAYPGLAALPLTGVLMAVGLVVDIGFTIIGDKPDLQKAIDVALDVASLAVLFIPVIGVVIAIIIQLVKFIIDLFGEDLFGGGMSHEQREVLEAARYGEALNPMFPILANAYTPRELYRAITAWTVGYNPAFPGGHCGGQQPVAMPISVVLKTGDRLRVGGQWYTVPAPPADGVGGAPLYAGADITPILGMTLLGIAAPGCYNYVGTPYAAMTADEIAEALAIYAPVNGVIAVALLGVAEWRKEQFNDPTERLIMTRALPMRDFLVKHRLSLDQIDQIALEYRAQPHLNALGAAYGWASWQELFASVVAQEWQAFNMTVTEGSLSDFARQNGYPTMYAFRAAALASFEEPYRRLQATITASRSIESLSWFIPWYTGIVNSARPVVRPIEELQQVVATYGGDWTQHVTQEEMYRLMPSTDAP